MSAKPTKIEQQVRALIDSLGFVIEDDEGATTIIYKENDGEEYHFLIRLEMMITASCEVEP